MGYGVFVRVPQTWTGATLVPNFFGAPVTLRYSNYRYVFLKPVSIVFPFSMSHTPGGLGLIDGSRSGHRTRLSGYALE